MAASPTPTYECVRIAASRGHAQDERFQQDSRFQLGANLPGELLKTKKLDPGTVNVAIAALRHLFTALGRPAVMQGIRGVRKQYRAPDMLSGSEVERLLLASTNVKHRAMFMLPEQGYAWLS